ncbi:dockerin type I repeat-containing protein [bacterium]|nr:dockerin type I repeat-containing protein [bacterium]
MKHKVNRFLLFFAVSIFMISIYMSFCPAISMAGEPVWVKAVQYNPGADMVMTPAQPLDLARMKTLYSPGTNYTSSDALGIIVGLAERLAFRQRPDGAWTEDLLPGITPENIAGPVGLGMLRAYNLTQNAFGMNVNGVTVDPDKYLNSAGLAAKYLLDPNRVLPLGANDCIFLYCRAYWMDPARNPQNIPEYASIKAALEGYIGSQASAPALYNEYKNVEPQLMHYWAANMIEACQLFGSQVLKTFADQMVAVALGSYYSEPGNVGVFLFDTTYKYVRTMSHARMIEVLAKYYGGSTVGGYSIDSVVSKGAEFLKDVQHITDPNNPFTGAFRAGAQINSSDEVQAFDSILVQDQAFAVSAMAFAKQTTYANYQNDKGPYWGAKTLIQLAVNAQPTGGKRYLDDGKEYAEDNAEAIYGFYASCREGDVDKSGKVMAGDALKALKASVGQINLIGPEFVSADRNGDGDILSGDAVDILKHSVGIPVAVPNK